MNLVTTTLPPPKIGVFSSENKTRSNSLVSASLRQNGIPKAPCCVCGSEKSIAHHEDYEKPLEIIWLCQKHHIQRHKELGWGIQGKKTINKGGVYPCLEFGLSAAQWKNVIREFRSRTRFFYLEPKQLCWPK